MIIRHPVAAGRLPLLWTFAALLTACAGPPWRRSEPVAAPTASTPEARSRDCRDLKAEIAWHEKSRRVAPPLTTSPEIAAAAVGKNDNKIEELRQRYEMLGCDDTR